MLNIFIESAATRAARCKLRAADAAFATPAAQLQLRSAPCDAQHSGARVRETGEYSKYEKCVKDWREMLFKLSSS